MELILSDCQNAMFMYDPGSLLFSRLLRMETGSAGIEYRGDAHMGKKKKIIVEESFRNDKEEDRKKAFTEKTGRLILRKETPERL